MKTVCFCNSNIAWGGGEKWHYDAALALAARGWRVFLVCHPKGALYARAVKEARGVEVIPMPLGRLSFINPFKRKRLVNFFRDKAPHAVILNLPADLKAAGLAAKAAGVPNIIFRRGLAVPVKNTALNRLLYGQVITRLIVNSKATLEAVLANNPTLVSKDKVTLLFNGIDADAFDAELKDAESALQCNTEAVRGADSGLSAAAQQTFRELYCLSRERGTVILGNAGRLTEQKGQHYLLYLGALLHERGLDFRLVIAGEGELRSELEDLACKLGIQDKVLFIGFLADLSFFWQVIDIFILSSLWEGFGYVLLEAMLAEKPVVAFRVSNIPELVTDGVNGLLFPAPLQGGDGMALPEVLVEGVLRLARDKDVCRRLGENGRQFALQGFSHSASMDILEQII